MRWHHGHSIGTGLLFGITLAQHGILILFIGGLLGFFGRDIYALFRGVAHLVSDRFSRKEGGKVIRGEFRK